MPPCQMRDAAELPLTRASLWRRWFGRVTALLIIAALSSCATLLWGWTNSLSVEPAELTTGLPRELAKTSSAFNERVKARFPVGMPLAEVGAELSREKFVRQDWSSLPSSQHLARRYDGGAPACSHEADVTWQSDNDDRLVWIAGSYAATCL